MAIKIDADQRAAINHLLDAYRASDEALKNINAVGFGAVLFVANNDTDDFTEVKLDPAVAKGAIHSQQKMMADALHALGIDVS